MEKVRIGEQSDLSDVLKELIESYNKMLGIVDSISKVTKKTKMLSFNSAIEAARAGEAGRGFQVISKHIQELAGQSEEANNSSLETIGEMNRKIHDVVGLRIADMAFDLMDKIDRQLYERNCDVQVWARNETIQTYFKEQSEENRKKVNELLGNIVDINAMYLDIFLADADGKLIAAARSKDELGMDVSKKTWYQAVVKEANTTVSDLYHSPTLDSNTIAFGSPVRGKHGEFLGVLTTRFNWDYIMDIVTSARVSEHGEFHLVNHNGIVIASKDKNEVLRKDVSDTKAAVNALNNKQQGYLLEEDQNNNIVSATGYAPSSGFNTYKGKGWAVIVKEVF